MYGHAEYRLRGNAVKFPAAAGDMAPVTVSFGHDAHPGNILIASSEWLPAKPLYPYIRSK